MHDSSSPGTLIVGGGHAGYQCAESLRHAGYTDPITIIDAQPHLPYQRPPLTKTYLQVPTEADRLHFRPASYFADHQIELLLGRRVSAIDRQTRQLTLDNGETREYHSLVLATGARLRYLNCPGAQLQGVHYIRHLDDVHQIQKHLPVVQQVVIIGGGFISLECAATLCQLGKKVTVLEIGDRLMARSISQEISAFMQQVHEEHGVTVRFDSQVEMINGNDLIESVQLASGDTLPAQLVMVGIGVEPEITLAQQADLVTNEGILVDEHCRTSDPAIYAAGDCTEFISRFAERQLRLESVQNATDQAKIVAEVIAGKENSYDAIPWFWTDQHRTKLQMAGLHQGYTRVHQRGDMEEQRFSLFYFRDHRLIAVHSINRPGDHMSARKLLAAGISPTQTQVEDMEFKLSSLLKPR